MEKNLFQQAKEMMKQMTNNQADQSTPYDEDDQQAVRQAIQAAYQDATPEEQQQLNDFEQELDKKMD